MQQPSQSPQPDYDVLIVGGGMVGATLACALGDSPLRVGLVEARTPQFELLQNEATPFDPRVSALTQASRNLLANLGVWDLIADYRHCAFRGMHVWDAEGTGEISFTAEDLGQQWLGYIVENSVTETALLRRTREFANIEMIAPAEVQSLDVEPDGQATITLGSGAQLTARLIVGADGGRSGIRELAGIEVDESDYGQQAIVTTVKVAESHQSIAWQRFLPTGPLAFLPVMTRAGEDHYCSIVWSLDTAAVEQYMACDDDEFKLALARAFEYKLGAVESVEQRFSFGLRQRHASTYYRPGLALVGDAAHTIHPLAGQGVNLGLMDAAVLAEEVLRAQARGLAPGEASVLARYERRRRGENLLMLKAVGGFKQLFGQTALPARWLRSSGMSLVNRLAPVKNHLAARAMGLNGDLPRLARVNRH